MKSRFLCWSFVASLAGLSPAIAAPSTAQPPNIILILADDMGYSDIGCYGGEIATPNIDRLAQQGIRFTQAYNTSKCFPSRAALLTGVYAQQCGFGDTFRNPIRNAMTLGEALQQVGYRTYWSGKHHGMEIPETRGFEKFYGLLDGASNHFNPGTRRLGEPEPAKKAGRPPRVWRKDGKIHAPYTPEDRDFYTTDAFTDYALKWLANHDTEKAPFFLYLAYTAPHDPLMAWPEDIAKYEGAYDRGYEAVREARFEKQRQLGILGGKHHLPKASHRDWETLSDFEKSEEIRRMEVYAAMIDRMDQNIGRVLRQLEAIGVRENTLILFASDNGASAEVVEVNPAGTIGTIDRWTSLGRDWANVSNTPLRYFKNDSYEGGIRTPLIAYWPEGIGTTMRMTDTPVHFIDFMATFVDLAGAPYLDTFKGDPLVPLQGRSLAPVFRGASQLSPRPLYWEWGQGKAVRLGEWKLVSDGESWELYNLKDDPFEAHNLAEQEQEISAALSTLHDLWRNNINP